MLYTKCNLKRHLPPIVYSELMDFRYKDYYEMSKSVIAIHFFSKTIWQHVFSETRNIVWFDNFLTLINYCSPEIQRQCVNFEISR